MGVAVAVSDGDKADIALKKAQAYQVDVNAGQIPSVALANGRVNQLIEDGTYPGFQKALEEAAAEGDTIEEMNAPAPAPVMAAGVDPVTGAPVSGRAPKGNGQIGNLPPSSPPPPRRAGSTLPRS